MGDKSLYKQAENPAVIISTHLIAQTDEKKGKQTYNG